MDFSIKNQELKKNNRNVMSKILKTMISKTTLILLLMTVMLCRCSGDDDSTNSDQTGFTLTATVDGVNYSSDFVTVSALPDESDVYIISGVGEASSIGLTLESPISTGTFAPSVGGLTVLFYQDIDPYAVWGATEDEGSGTITITENTDTYIKGTFSFTGINPADNTTKEVTDGNFKARKL